MVTGEQPVFLSARTASYEKRVLDNRLPSNRRSGGCKRLARAGRVRKTPGPGPPLN